MRTSTVVQIEKKFEDYTQTPIILSLQVMSLKEAAQK